MLIVVGGVPGCNFRVISKIYSEGSQYASASPYFIFYGKLCSQQQQQQQQPRFFRGVIIPVITIEHKTLPHKYIYEQYRVIT